MEKLCNLIDLSDFDDTIFLNTDTFTEFLDRYDFCYLYAYDGISNTSTIQVPAKIMGAEYSNCSVNFEFKPNSFSKMYVEVGTCNLEILAGAYLAATILVGQFRCIDFHRGERYIALKGAM